MCCRHVLSSCVLVVSLPSVLVVHLLCLDGVPSSPNCCILVSAALLAMLERSVSHGLFELCVDIMPTIGICWGLVLDYRDLVSVAIVVAFVVLRIALVIVAVLVAIVVRGGLRRSLFVGLFRPSRDIDVS